MSPKSDLISRTLRYLSTDGTSCSHQAYLCVDDAGLLVERVCYSKTLIDKAEQLLYL